MIDTSSTLIDIGVLQLLRDAVSKLAPPPSTQHSTTKISAPRDLDTCSQILIRVDAAGGPLQASDEDPFKIVERSTHVTELASEFNR